MSHKKGTILKVRRNLINQRFGNLLVISEGDRIRTGKFPVRSFFCLCDCGVIKQIRYPSLTGGRTTSCGCSYEKHGESKTKLYRLWSGIIARVSYDSPNFHRYIIRGITVCDEWRDSFLAFKSWAVSNGYSPGLQIDRIDNDGNYEPSNCRFATRLVNMNNRHNTLLVNYNNTTIPLKTILREKGLSRQYVTIRGRIVNGMTADEAINMPIEPRINFKRS